jgi:hypothetical protein
VATVTLMGMASPAGICVSQNTSNDECSRTAHLNTYSNAVFVQEAGDVIGYELVVQQSDGHSISALLYVYEGVPNEDGISVSGQISGRSLTMKGSWVQHLIEHPSGKEIVETLPVEVSGTLDSKRFRGAIKISDNPTSVTLKRAAHIWLCRNR